MKYVIGIDGGGTGSTLKLFSTEGIELLSRKGGPTNLSAQPSENVEDVLRRLILGAIDDLGFRVEDCEALCIGAAGCARDFQRDILGDIIRGIGIRGKIDLRSDYEVALFAGAGKLEGIIIISGTGAIGYGKNGRDESFRTGGWGHIVGDEGSGYYIGLRALNAAIKSHDGRGQKTILLPSLMKAIGIDRVEEFIEFIYSNTSNKSRIADLGVLVDEAFKEGDIVARQILDDSAYELYLLVDAILNQINFKEPISLVAHGSVLCKNDHVFRRFSSLIDERHKDIEIIRLDRDAAYGAVEIALNMVK